MEIWAVFIILYKELSGILEVGWPGARGQYKMNSIFSFEGNELLAAKEGFFK
jgi:hypothetical protein